MSDTYQRVYSRIWDEPWGEDTRYFAFYVLTVKHRTFEGLYKLPLGYAAHDLNWTARKVRRELDALCADGMVKYDHQAAVIWIVNALDGYGLNKNQALSAVNKIKRLPETPLLQEFLNRCETVSPILYRTLRKEFPEGFAKGSGNPSLKAVA